MTSGSGPVGSLKGGGLRWWGGGMVRSASSSSISLVDMTFSSKTSSS
jgi:hypothetical protein